MELQAKVRKSGEKLETGMIPAVAYNKEKNVSFAIERKAFDRIFRSQGISGLFDIAIEGEEAFPALVKTVQMDKRRREPIHVDFYMVTYGQAIEANVPLHTTGRSQGEIEGGLVDIVHHNVTVLAPGPRRIPQELVADLSGLNIGDHITAGQLELPEGVELVMDPEITLISILPPRLTEEELEAETEAAAAAGAEAAAMGQEDEEAGEDLPKEGTEGRNLDKDNHKAEEIRSESGQESN
ncbi:50S ribosomal protein L25 [Deinococcus radiophilus]|uniref:Large ribosomal subunit protein bL25 n=1 Tax=Deinococcus radiophilus TaxID=32062 RepID=A0A3S0KNP9_9DEIO|nr:50S ribosomal protein L25 [Deinococcus radiophilus]RTR30938.1 50S ribosomal protein L25 [Deinococcus radiophilus]UFA49521.1 50S ribosomal protein L25 [Deinococcus radiophilus]